MSHNIKSITVQVKGNDAAIEIIGAFMNPKYSIDNIEIKYHDNGIELYIHALYDENGPVIAITSPIHETITINNLKHGRYYARVDNNNKWVKWFDVA